MIITKAIAAERLGAYLRHELSFEELIDWAERGLMDGEFPEDEADGLAETLARLGLADVRNFGLSWEDCEGLLQRLGYRARVEIYSE